MLFPVLLTLLPNLNMLHVKCSTEQRLSFFDQLFENTASVDIARISTKSHSVHLEHGDDQREPHSELTTMKSVSACPAVRNVSIEGVEWDYPGPIVKRKASRVTKLDLRDCSVSRRSMYYLLDEFKCLEVFRQSYKWSSPAYNIVSFNPSLALGAVLFRAKHTLKKLIILSQDSNVEPLDQFSYFKSLEEIHASWFFLVPVRDSCDLNGVLPASVQFEPLRISRDDDPKFGSLQNRFFAAPRDNFDHGRLA